MSMTQSPAGHPLSLATETLIRFVEDMHYRSCHGFNCVACSKLDENMIAYDDERSV